MAKRKPRSGSSTDSDVSKGPKIRGIGDTFRDVGVRETIESILVAVMLALLFKAFEAEAFVIPTGSMAPTLMGQHKDVVCPQCSFSYRVNASEEARSAREVLDTTCPICRYAMRIDEQKDRNHDTFSGDRILVSKFAYDIAEPNRWDVIVFRYPNNAKQNYIKRLTGLPGEHVLIENGDLLVWMTPKDNPDALPQSRSEFSIARKDPRKLLAMLQLVDDTDYLAEELIEVDWPLRWQEWSTDESQRVWISDFDSGKLHYTVEAGATTAWLNYRHLVPRRTEWSEISAGRLPERIVDSKGELISDYYEYNDSTAGVLSNTRGEENENEMFHRGVHWVGDLTLDAQIKVNSKTGTLLLQLVEGGVKYTCEIDVESGQATVAPNSDLVRFFKPDGTLAESGSSATAETPLRGTGSYRVRFGNADDRLYLWINNRSIEFDLPLTFERTGPVRPQWSPSEPGDAEPLRIGARELSLEVDRLRAWRDIYYISARDGIPVNDYVSWIPPTNGGNGAYSRSAAARKILDSPEMWATPIAVDMFDSRNRDPFDSFRLEQDQYFALGDNSPASSDARTWLGHEYVEGENLVGKALFVYWPHTWWKPVPFFPNFKRMGFIR